MTPLFQHPAFWFAVAFVVLLAANFYVFHTRNWEESLYPTDYARLHYALDIPTLRTWTVKSRMQLRLDIVWNGDPKWQLYVDGKPSAVLTGNKPVLDLVGSMFDGTSKEPIEKFEHHYRLRPLPEGAGPDLDFRITAIDVEFYRKRAMWFPKDAYLVHTDLPVGNFRRHPVSYWVDDYRYISADALAAADRVVREEMGIRDTDDTFTRMDKVMRHICTVFANCTGVPKDAFRWMDPWSIFQEMVAGTGEGWCTQKAQIYTFFANRAGVPTRFVFAAYTQHNQIVFNGHSWAESWIKEQGRWTYVDPSHTLIAILDSKGLGLNTADLMHLNEHEIYGGLQARVMKDWHWKNLDIPAGQAVIVPYAQVNLLPKTYLNRQTIIKYRRPPNVEDTRDLYSMLLKSPTFTWVNFQRYLFKPTLAYSRERTDGYATYATRRLLFGGLVVSLIGLLLSLR